MHPKDASIGSKAVFYSKEVWIEKDDALEIQEGEKVTLMKWGNALITKKVVDGDSISLFGKLDLEDKNFKKTKKITWITADSDVLV